MQVYELPQPHSVSVSGKPGGWTVTVTANDGRKVSLSYT